ncbi:MAG: spermidine synthase [Pseudomonadota bacterium]|nr:spermidine synthase [Pseudomonadota bacterium]
MKRDKTAAIVLILFVWGLAGALFGSLFAGLYQVLLVLGVGGWKPLVVGAAAAAMTTSAFYSAMPVALVGAMAGVIASIAYLMVTGHRVELFLISSVAAVAGLVAGSFYAWMVKGGGRPLAQTLRGLLAGLAAGGLLAAGLSFYGGDVGMFVMAAGVVALVGSLFQLSERWFVGRISGWCPRTVSAPVVAALIAAVVGASVWIMGGVTAGALDSATKGAIDQVLREVPAGFLGGLLGGAVTGVLLELMGVHLEERA